MNWSGAASESARAYRLGALDEEHVRTEVGEDPRGSVLLGSVAVHLDDLGAPEREPALARVDNPRRRRLVPADCIDVADPDRRVRRLLEPHRVGGTVPHTTPLARDLDYHAAGRQLGWLSTGNRLVILPAGAPAAMNSFSHSSLDGRRAALAIPRRARRRTCCGTTGLEARVAQQVGRAHDLAGGDPVRFRGTSMAIQRPSEQR